MNNYSQTKCPKCEKAKFELVDDIPSNGNERVQYWYLRCENCKTFLHAFDFTNINDIVINADKKIDKIFTAIEKK